MKKFYSFLACLVISAGMFAQEEAAPSPWKYDGSLGLNAAATGLVNWTAGGKNNMNGFVYAKLHFLYEKDAMAWETNFDTDFGLTWIDQKEDPFQKSSDNIKLATKFGWAFKENWYLTVSAGFQSQYALGRKYADGYNYITSKWLAPSHTDISVGIDWKKSVNGCDFSVYLSPVAGRITTAYTGEKWNQYYTREQALGEELYELEKAKTPADKAIAQAIYDAAAAQYDKNDPSLLDGYDYYCKQGYDMRSLLQEKNGTIGYDKKTGDPIYRSARIELGLSFKGGIAYTYNDFKLSTTLGLFTPYQGKGFNVKDTWLAATNEDGTARTQAQWDARPAESRYFEWSSNNRYFGNFDVEWDVALGYQFLKCLQVTLQTNLRYYPGTLITDADGNVSERVQFKGVLGLGVGYSF